MSRTYHHSNLSRERDPRVRRNESRNAERFDDDVEVLDFLFRGHVPPRRPAAPATRVRKAVA